MRFKEHWRRLEQDPEFAAAQEELRPFFQIADEVISLRMRHGWTQADLARRVGTRQANISRLENALGNPTLRFLQKVARAFGERLNVSLQEGLPTPKESFRSEAARRFVLVVPSPVCRVQTRQVGAVWGSERAVDLAAEWTKGLGAPEVPLSSRQELEQLVA